MSFSKKCCSNPKCYESKKSYNKLFALLRVTEIELLVSFLTVSDLCRLQCLNRLAADCPLVCHHLSKIMSCLNGARLNSISDSLSEHLSSESDLVERLGLIEMPFMNAELLERYWVREVAMCPPRPRHQSEWPSLYMGSYQSRRVLQNYVCEHLNCNVIAFNVDAVRWPSDPSVLCTISFSMPSKTKTNLVQMQVPASRERVHPDLDQNLILPDDREFLFYLCKSTDTVLGYSKLVVQGMIDYRGKPQSQQRFQAMDHIWKFDVVGNRQDNSAGTIPTDWLFIVRTIMIQIMGSKCLCSKENGVICLAHSPLVFLNTESVSRALHMSRSCVFHGSF
jgi:hypothetical protein